MRYGERRLGDQQAWIGGDEDMETVSRILLENRVSLALAQATVGLKPGSEASHALDIGLQAPNWTHGYLFASRCGQAKRIPSKDDILTLDS